MNSPDRAPGPWGRLVAWVHRINRLAALGSGLLLLAMVGMICREAIGRYFFDAPTDWVVELSGFLLVGVVFMGGAFIQQEDAHLRVDVFYERFTRRNRAWVDLLGYVLAVVYLGFLEWQSALLAWKAFQSSEMSMIMRWPVYLPELFVPVGVGLLALQVLLQMAGTVAELSQSRRG